MRALFVVMLLPTVLFGQGIPAPKNKVSSPTPKYLYNDSALGVEAYSKYLKDLEEAKKRGDNPLYDKKQKEWEVKNNLLKQAKNRLEIKISGLEKQRVKDAKTINDLKYELDWSNNYVVVLVKKVDSLNRENNKKDSIILERNGIIDDLTQKSFQNGIKAYIKYVKKNKEYNQTITEGVEIPYTWLNILHFDISFDVSNLRCKMLNVKQLDLKIVGDPRFKEIPLAPIYLRIDPTDKTYHISGSGDCSLTPGQAILCRGQKLKLQISVNADSSCELKTSINFSIEPKP